MPSPVSRRRIGFGRFAVALAIALAFVVQMTLPALAVGGVSGTLNGTIVDNTTKAPLANVTVTALSPSQRSTATTDARGFFTFPSLPTDTYTVSFQLAGYEPFTLTGVTIFGDQTVSLGNVTISKSLQVVGRVTSRSRSSAYQPTQTTDSYQVSGQTLQTAQGKQFNISQTQLQSSVPGIVTTAYGSSSIRGSTRTEIAYQFEGVNYTEPLTNQFSNSLGLNGVTALQVNPGAGDATQGNAGAGTVNLVAKRGTFPAFGTLDLETRNFPYAHQLAVEYGWATPDGKFSNYTSFLGQGQASQFGPIGTPAVVSGSFFTSQNFTTTRDFINNFFWKFGKNQRNTLQVFYQSRYSDFEFDRGGYTQLCYKTCDPNYSAQFSTTSYFAQGTAAQRLANFQQVIGLLPGQSSPIQNLYYAQFNHQPVDFFKLELDQNVSPTMIWKNRLYRIVSATRFDRPYESQVTTSRVNLQQGGNVNGLNGELTKQFGDKHLTTLSYLFEQRKGLYDNVQNVNAYRALTPAVFSNGGYEIADFLPSTGFTCPTTDPLGNKLVNVPGTNSPCGYLAKYFGGTTPRIPLLDFISPGVQLTYGIGIRDQWTVNQKLRVDYGLRIDAANYNLRNSGNTTYSFGNDVLRPSVLQPRIAASYQLGANDAVRGSYGRSVQFIPAGIMNSPIAVPNGYAGIPSYDNRTGGPATWCGPKNNQVCPNYAQQLHDEFVGYGGPEAYPTKPATYGNWDFSYQHQFKNNIGLKITPFYKRGYNVPVFSTPVIGTDPVSGLPQFGPSILTNLGVDKTTGVEFYLTRDVQYGLSGFVNLTYVNRLQNIPPGYLGQTEDFYPSAPPQSLALGQLYRAGYLSPLSGRLGLSYKSKGGFRVNPVVTYDRGYPIGAGLLAPVTVNGVNTVIPSTNANVVGFGASTIAGTPALATSYVDPQNPGSIFRPNVAATRGTAEQNLSGGVLSRPRFSTDISFEYSVPNTRSTFGVYVNNVFNQVYSEPSLNSRWQPVATGVPGPLTGQTSGTVLYGTQLGYYNWGPERFGQNAYILTPSNAPIGFRFYYNLAF